MKIEIHGCCGDEYYKVTENSNVLFITTEYSEAQEYITSHGEDLSQLIDKRSLNEGL